MSHTVNQAAEVVSYMLSVSAVAGDTLNAPKLMSLVYHVQGWSLALEGRPAFSEAIERGVNGPVTASTRSLLREPRVNLDTPVAIPSLPPSLQNIVHAVLRHYGGFTGWQLLDDIVRQSLWKHSVYTEGRIDQRNHAAYYAALRPLELSVAGPVQVEFPVKDYKSQQYSAADARTTLRRQVEDKEREQAELNERLGKAFGPPPQKQSPPLGSW